MDRVAFITVEDGDDLLVSFALVAREPAEVVSVTLMRTPKYEYLFDAEERGVSFSDERSAEEAREFVSELRIQAGTVAIKTDRSDYTFDLSAVEAEELVVAGQILRKMNFDHRIQLSLP